MGRKSSQRLQIVYPDCAGIDIGSREHWVAINPERTEQPVRRFGSFSDDLQALAAWLADMGVHEVAMEATGVYWIPLYELLESLGFAVHLVNARATRQVSGRKSDVLDCQWIRQLMAHGLLRGAFRPGDGICRLRSLVRQRGTLVKEQARCTAHLQKALTQMNVQIDQVVGDLTGKTGMAILRAIVAGERDPQRLAALRDRRVRASEATIARSLQGNWRMEHLFALTQALERHDFLGRQIGQCDNAIQSTLDGLPQRSDAASLPVKRLTSGGRSAAAQAACHRALQGLLGVDLTAIPTIALDTALVLAGEIGPDLGRFPTCAHFCSWLGLAPPTRISGGKPLPGRGPKVINRAGQALRQAASNARRSESFIGAAHRARLARMDAGQAIKATAHQLARWIYALLTRGQAYVERGIEAFEVQRHERQLRALYRKAAKLGVNVVQAA